MTSVGDARLLRSLERFPIKRHHILRQPTSFGVYLTPLGGLAGSIGTESALGCFVALWRNDKIFGAGQSRAAVLEAELGFSASPKRVPIGNRAIEVNGRGAEPDFGHLLFGERLGDPRPDRDTLASGIDR